MEYWNEPRNIYIYFWKALPQLYLEKLILIPKQQNWS